MANRIGPLDQNMIGKIGNKVEDTGTTNRLSRDDAVDRKDASGGTPASDTVQLTAAAKLLERLEKSLDSLPAVDARRVEEIRTAIRSGDYQIDAKAIADAMLRFERAMDD